MGRGRAKAKQTRVARDLKYRPIDTDFASLERELRGEVDSEEDLLEEVPDPYADLVGKYEVDTGKSDADEDEFTDADEVDIDEEDRR